MKMELQDFLEQSHYFRGEIIVLEKTENSELLDTVKPCNEEFFEAVFSPNGPYWKTYSTLGFGKKPLNAKYLVLADNKMYFCRNTEKHFMYAIGPKKNFRYSNSRVSEKYPFSLDNLLLLLSTPFDFARQVSAVALSALKLNEKLQEFEKFSTESKKFLAANAPNSNANEELIKKSLQGAIDAMEYSFYASMAYSLKTKLKESSSWSDCELENLSNFAGEKGANGKIKEEFGFYSKNPYDISMPRFNEEPESAIEFKKLKAPKNPAARWRENCKFLCARYLGVLREIYLSQGKESGLGGDIFFLKPNELFEKSAKSKPIISGRKELYNSQSASKLPKTLVFDGKWNIPERKQSGKIIGLPAGGQRIVSGEVVFVDQEIDFKKKLDGKIVVSQTLSPNLVMLFDRISGIVSAGGGRTAHTAIVAIEQNMPCVVQTKNIGSINEGDSIRVDGSTGKIEKL